MFKKVTIMMGTLLIVGVMTLFTAWSVYAQSPTRTNAPIVRSVLFYDSQCPHCEYVREEVLPPLQSHYGDQLVITQLEINDPRVYEVFLAALDQYHIPPEMQGVPFLIIGDVGLVGSEEISEQFPGQIERYLAESGVDYPKLPGLESLVISPVLSPPAYADASPYNPANRTIVTPTPSSSEDLCTLSTPCAPVETNSVQQPANSTSTQNRTDQGVDETSGVQVTTQNQATIYIFWGDGCPHCAEAIPFLQDLDQGSDQVALQMYEVYHDQDNQDLFTKMAAAYGFEPHGVPTIFVGKQHWEGYNDQIKNEIQAVVDACLVNGCPDAGVGIITGVVDSTGAAEMAQSDLTPATGKRIDIPLVGTVDLSSQSLLVSTLLISFVDGVNPCSVWVLTMLLAITLHTGSRKKVLLIGLIFLTVTAGVYALFIAGLFTVFKVVSFVGWIQVAVAVVALFFALVNIKDYFWYKEGISFTIADDKKPGIFQRIRRVMDAGQSFWGLVGGTIVLAGGVSLVEFSCTAGFPVLWTNLLVAQNVPVLTFVLLLLVYLVIYQLDEMGIFFVAVLTMRTSKLEEKHGRILKLIGGMLMLSLAGVMLINPSLMNNLSSSLIVFGAAFGATLVVLLVHRTILPRFGVHIGTEFRGKAIK